MMRGAGRDDPRAATTADAAASEKLPENTVSARSALSASASSRSRSQSIAAKTGPTRPALACDLRERGVDIGDEVGSERRRSAAATSSSASGTPSTLSASRAIAASSSSSGSSHPAADSRMRRVAGASGPPIASGPIGIRCSSSRPSGAREVASTATSPASMSAPAASATSSCAWWRRPAPPHARPARAPPMIEIIGIDCGVQSVGDVGAGCADCQIDEPRRTPRLLGQRSRGLDRKPSLADAPRPEDRQESMPGRHRAHDPLDVVLATPCRSAQPWQSHHRGRRRWIRHFGVEEPREDRLRLRGRVDTELLDERLAESAVLLAAPRFGRPHPVPASVRRRWTHRAGRRPPSPKALQSPQPIGRAREPLGRAPAEQPVPPLPRAAWRPPPNRWRYP